MYSSTFRDRLRNIKIWLSHIGWMHIAGLTILGLIIYVAISLAMSTPATKLLVTLVSVMTYNIVGGVAKMTLGKANEKNKKVSMAFGCIILVCIPVGVYGLILSAFVLPWFVTACIGLSLIFAFIFVMVDEKKLGVKIPLPVFWIRNILTIFAFLSMIYYLAKFLGWI